MRDSRTKIIPDFLDFLSVEQREEINRIIFGKGDRVEIGPGPNGTVKISHVKREFLKSGRLKERPKS